MCIVVKILRRSIKTPGGIVTVERETEPVIITIAPRGAPTVQRSTPRVPWPVPQLKPQLCRGLDARTHAFFSGL